MRQFPSSPRRAYGSLTSSCPCVCPVTLETMPFPPGTTLGPSSVTDKIGEGGTGEVYRARDTRLDRVRDRRVARRMAAALSRLVVPAVLVLAVTTSAVSAQSHLDRTEGIELRGAAIRALKSVERTPQVTLPARSRQSTPQRRSWIERHPVLFGAIVGAVAGAAIVGATVDAEASFVGFYGGAAGGAVVGWAVSR